MAGTIHGPWSLEGVRSSKEEDRRAQHKNGTTYIHSNHKLLNEPLGLYSKRKFIRRRTGLLVLTQTQYGELCAKRKRQQIMHGKHPLCDDDCSSYVALLRTCAKNKDLHKGTSLHYIILQRGLLDRCSDALVTMYAKCGALAKAQELLDIHKSRDVFSWTALIAGYARHGLYQDALNCFKRMQHMGLSPDAVTFACILKACANLKAADMGERIHEEISSQGLLGSDVVLGTALVDMYAKCGALAKAERVLEELPFRNVVSWSALIAGYAQEGKAEQALSCFERMQHEGHFPNTATFACILKACGTIGASNKGVQIHNEIIRQGLLKHNIVLGTALMDMYIKCRDMAKAEQLLEELPFRDVVTWSALIAGYAQQGQGEQALKCFEKMQCEGLSPDPASFGCILKACGTIGAVDKGKQIHDEIVKQGMLQNNVMLGTALVDMYAKCGALAKAQQVLEEIPSRDVVSWSALIAGYAKQGQAEKVLDCFKRMQQEGFCPDTVTFSCVLNAYAHLGLEEEGHVYFVDMNTKYNLKPSLEHFTCMVDLFGRAGHLEKAIKVIQEVPSSDYPAVWFALLGACQKWGDVNVGRWAFEKAIQLDKCNGAPYVLMANVYAAAGMQEDVSNIEAMRKENKAWKKPGQNFWIDMSGTTHAFVGHTKLAQDMGC